MAEYATLSGGLASPEGPQTPAKSVSQMQPSKPALDEGLDFLVSLTKRLEREDQVTDRMFHQKWLKVSKFYEGEHLGRFDSQGQWRSYSPQLGDPYFIHPEMRFHSDAITAAWTQSRPDIRVLPANDNDETVAKARKAGQILDHYEDTQITEEFLQREGKLGQFTGQMYRFTWWDPNKGPLAPRYEPGEQEIPLHEGMVECPDCGYLEPIQQAENEVCPQCGAAMELHGPESLTMPTLEPAGQYHIGDIVTECVPAFQVKIDRSAGEFSCSTFLRRRRLVRQEILKEMFPQWEMPSQTGTSTDDFGLRAERILQQSTGAPGRAWRSDILSSAQKGVVINQWWLAPCLYSTRGPELKDIEFVSGGVIPKGTRLAEVFPTGLYLLIVDGKILDMREEYLHDHWQHSPFCLIPTRVEGDGVEDLLEPQRELNDLMSLLYVDAKANSAPPTVVNTTYGLKTTDVAGKPHWVIPARVPTGERIDNAIWQMQGRGTPPSVFKLIEMIRGGSQLYAKSFSAATGAPDAATNGHGTDTATGAQLATSAAQSQRGPELSIRAFGSIIWARQVLKLFQKNATDKHYVPLQGRYGLLEGQYFKGSDIDAEFIILVRDRSWIPRDEMSRRADLLGAIQAGLFMPELPRAVRDEIAEVFNVSVSITTDIADTRIARMRLEQMEQLMPQLSQAGLPPEVLVPLLLQAVILEPVSDNHQAMIDWYIMWLKTDEGLQADPILRQAITGRIQEHKQAVTMLAQEQLIQQMEIQAPMMQMQMAQQQAQQGQQQEQEAQQGEVQHERDMEKIEKQGQQKKQQAPQK